MLDNKTINELIGVTESFHASYKLFEILEDKETRESLFNKFLQHETDLSYDWFTDYFQEEHSDRKGKKQDFTPDCVVTLLSDLLSETKSNVDICSGTGGLTIKRYASNQQAKYYCEEFSDRAMPFLLFNLTIRNVDAYVLHGDSLTREFKTVYKLTKSETFSDISKVDDAPEWNAQTVIMNPPYSLAWNPLDSYKYQERFIEYGIAPKAKADFAFLLQGFHMLDEQGRIRQRQKSQQFIKLTHC